eukprot:CAMPEP_0184699830 /NCGR_PEP_ID=MMETSP0313-20130426/5942_1 /TAXON_ID=2792 /ORGANISM="Porphyridium aerugineum, Strain SAG 1380-2" /LENGTH=44 /DNA_ID= /DNA_START= /DNA_END= /DNA_ORIENTATION=
MAPAVWISSTTFSSLTKADAHAREKAQVRNDKNPMRQVDMKHPA